MIAKSERMKTKKSHVSPKFFLSQPYFWFLHLIFQKISPVLLLIFSKVSNSPVLQKEGDYMLWGLKKSCKKKIHSKEYFTEKSEFVKCVAISSKKN